MIWIDSHCHLDLIKTAAESVLTAAHAVGVERVVTIGVDLASSATSVELARRFPSVSATVGIHPNESTGYGADQERALEALAHDPSVVGIGEAGLDYYRAGATPEEQEASFRSQIGIARRAGIPVVVHSRDAHADTKRILRDEAYERVVMHCFSGDAHDAADYLDLGAVLSFAGSVTFRNAPALQDAARHAPIDRMLVETDAPFLSPHPFRGQPNEPARIPVIGEWIAGLKGIAVGSLAEAMLATANSVWAGRTAGRAD